MPSRIEPSGLSAQQQWYLFEKIREFCPAADQDVTCPRLSIPRPASSNCTQEPMSPTNQSSSPTCSPPLKKTRHCGQCEEAGHKQSCLAQAQNWFHPTPPLPDICLVILYVLPQRASTIIIIIVYKKSPTLLKVFTWCFPVFDSSIFSSQVVLTVVFSI